MIANGVPVSFAISELFVLFGIVIAGYAGVWVIPRLIALFR